MTKHYLQVEGESDGARKTRERREAIVRALKRQDKAGKPAAIGALIRSTGLRPQCSTKVLKRIAKEENLEHVLDSGRTEMDG